MPVQLLIQPPLGGIAKNTGFQNRAPFTAYDLLNVWPIDPFTGRAIIASRPSLNTLTSPAGFVTLLQNVNGIVAGKPTQSFIGSFGGALYWWNGTGFTAATGAGATGHSTSLPIYSATLFDKVYIPRENSKPIAFDYETGAAAIIVETVGIAPNNTFFIVEWLGALWVVDLDEPHVLHACRVGEATDWNSSAPVDDEFGAFSSTVTSPGAIGAPINAMVPQTSDVALVSTLKGIFALRNHPRQGGVFDRLSTTYILGQGAWCKTPDDTVFFLTPKGLMSLPPGSGTIPSLVSKDKIPEELIGLEYEYKNPVVSMAYDSRWDGVQITVRGAEEQSWLYHLATGGFFRQEFIGYPYVLMEHEPFITDQSSGVLFGGVNLRFFDKFGTESFESSGSIGPVKLSESSHRTGRITKLKAIFGGDTPTGTGTLSVAVGTDGQDAVNRALLGNYQFETLLEKLEPNDGVCFPLINGHAAQVDFVTDDGIISLEGIEIAVDEGGINSLPRSVQIPPQGEAIDFTQVEDVFDDDNWIGYSQATPAIPNCSLPAHTLFVDLSRLPTTWWNTVNANGSDIRVTNNNNVEVPFDQVKFDKVAKTGFLTLKMAQQNPPTPVRIWAGNPFVGAYDPTAANGRFNAYDANYIAFWPSGGQDIVDRTVNANTLTMTGTDATALVAGPIGVQSTRYTALDATNNYGRAAAVVPSTYPVTLVTATLNTATQSIPCFGLRDQSGPTAANIELTANATAGNLHRTDAGSTDIAALASEAQSGTLAEAAVWRHNVAVVSAANIRAAYLDGGNKGTDTATITIASGVLDEIIVGKGSRSGVSSNSQLGDMALVQVHNVARDDCWVDYQWRMMDQVTFWGPWGGFVEVNPPSEINPPDPPPADTSSCPTGFVTPVETGTWSGYATATPSAPLANMPNWVHGIDLSLMPAAWWAAVTTDGHDIRATDQVNKFLPIDLIEFDKTNSKGFAAVRLNQSESAAVPIRLWVGNATAITLIVCANYGRYRVYDENWVGFWPSGGGNDRTQYRNHMTGVGGPVVGGVTGPIGNFATNYNGTTQYSTDIISPIVQSYPATFAAVTRATAFTQTGAVVSATRTKYLSHDTLIHTPQTNPTRFRARANDKTHDAVSLTTESANVWTHKVGLAANNITRSVVVAGGTLYSSPKKSLPQRPFAKLSIGARVTGSGEIYWPFTGDICLVSAHNAIRSLDNTWPAYQAAMLNQATFWGTGWVWAAESSSLPQ